MKTSSPCIKHLLPCLLLLLCHSTTLQAQVPVHEEPMHRPVYQDAMVRILDVHIPPGDTSLYHLHHTPSVFVFFTGTSYGAQLQLQAAQPGKAIAGRILFENLAAPNTRIHRVWNSDKDTFHVMDIELLYTDSGFAQPPLSHSFLAPETDTAWARTYRLTLPAGKGFMLRKAKTPCILVALESAAIQIKAGNKAKTQSVMPGTYVKTEAGQSISLKNQGEYTVVFALIELPGQ